MVYHPPGIVVEIVGTDAGDRTGEHPVRSRTTGYLFNFPAFYERGENLVTYKGRACKLY